MEHNKSLTNENVGWKLWFFYETDPFLEWHLGQKLSILSFNDPRAKTKTVWNCHAKRNKNPSGAAVSQSKGWVSWSRSVVSLTLAAAQFKVNSI